MWRFVAALVLVGAAVAGLAWLRPPAGRPQFLQRAGLLLMAGSTVISTLWLAAEASSDPGGWRGVALVGAVLATLAGPLAIAWYRAEWAPVLFTALTAVVIGLSGWFAIDPEAVRGFEDDNGPVRAVSVLVLAAPIAVAGWRRRLLAGVLLVVLGVVPVAVSAAGSSEGVGSLVAVALPAVLVGLLYLLAELMAGQAPATATGFRHGGRALGRR